MKKISLKNVCTAFLLSLCVFFVSCTGNSPVVEKKKNQDSAIMPALIPFVDENGQWGYSDSSQKIIIPCQYDEVTELYHGYGKITLHKKEALVDSTGKILTKLDYDYIDYTAGSHNRLFVMENEQYKGVIDASGKEVLSADYDDIETMGTVICAMRNGKAGIFDKAGKALTPMSYDNLEPDDFAGIIVLQQGNLFGFANAQGKVIVPPQYTAIGELPNPDATQIDLSPLTELLGERHHSRFKHSYTFKGCDGMIEFVKGKKYGLLNLEGKELLPAVYDEIRLASEGKASFCSHKKWGCINAKGEIILAQEYDHIGSFSEGMTAADQGDKTFLVDSLGGKKEIGTCSGVYFQKGISIACTNDKYGLINKKGEFVVAPAYDDLSREYGYYIAKAGTETTVFDAQGKKLFSCHYDGVGEFYNNTATLIGIKQNNKYGLIDLTGKVVLPPAYDSVYTEKNCFVLCNGAALGIAGPKGNVLEKPRFKTVYISRFGYLVPNASDSLAWFDLDGKRCTDYKFSTFSFNASDNGTQSVYSGDNSMHFIDYRGKEYWK